MRENAEGRRGIKFGEFPFDRMKKSDVDPFVEMQIDLDPQGIAFIAHADPLGRREKIPPRGRRVVFLKFL